MLLKEEHRPYGTSNTPGAFRQVEDYSDTYIDHGEPIGTVWPEEAIPLSPDTSRAGYLPRRKSVRNERNKDDERSV